jgi:hypothetical protein
MAKGPDPEPHLVPLKPPEAKPLFRDIMENGVVEFSSHAIDEIGVDNMETSDCLNVLRGGVVHPPDYVNGEWRYRVSTQRICIVVALASKMKLRVVTAWRIQR